MADDFISDEDKALFREQMKSVKPLDEKTKRVKPPVHKSPIKARKKIEPQESKPLENYLSDYISDSVLSDSILSYSISGFPNKRLRELKQGEIPWEARLDLHGFRGDEARDALFSFIKRQAENNARCLLIIHGKGGHLGAAPVIKNLINRWLPQFDEVIAYHSALAKDGGHGAVYVLLKRNRHL